MLDKYYHTKDIYYTREKMLAYMHDELPDFEKRAFEKLLEEDEFLRDAYAGLKMQSLKENQRAFRQIEADIDIITGAKKPRIISLNTRTVAVAAMLVIFIAASFLIVNQLNKAQQQKIATIQAEEYIQPATSEKRSDSILQITTETSGEEKTSVAPPSDASTDNAIALKEDARESVNATSTAGEPRPPAIAEMAEEEIAVDDVAKDSGVTANYSSMDEVAIESNAAKKSESLSTISTADAGIFIMVEQMPEFPGGETAMYKYLAENIKYPASAKEDGIEGTVYVKFLVNSKGKISNVEVVRGIGGGCDEEAVRVVKKMPVWNPGMQQGKPVDVNYTLPVKFQLH